MKVTLICIGKTNEKYLDAGIDIYLKRLKRYVNFSIEIVPDVKNAKNLSAEELKKAEAEKFDKIWDKYDYVLLLDEHGKQYKSQDFAKWIQHKQNASVKSIAFIIGGAYGFHNDLKQKANELISFSKMTFSHQMIRLFFSEQLYRAYSIIHGLPYHNE